MADAVATRVRAAIKARLLLLDLPEIDGRVYEQFYPDDSAATYPCVFLTLEGQSEQEVESTALSDYVAYPVRVMIADTHHPGDHTMLAAYEKWRELIAAAFRNHQLAAVPESVRCRIEPLVIADPSLPMYQHFVSGLVVRAVCKVPRGLGV